ncbi:origin recognition complex subunit 6 [Diplodia corticola]|uniref:Origin recognition complex subunit 6 n=1 Tax=Diplodia corticola TaxID=236234 RepID=A0A1J9R890_9PEZI|nr:origin recognition complex subunit 6 [Diplodia corticola]OJD37766.1 origin recognition complex subunit 6 [Diplodia corticola]
MSKPVEQALVGLVPAHNGPIPPELLNTAVSLLAQSRNKASSLRPEEEIARTYACAHLACERLKQRLNLPPIAPRPPIPPRAYKRVYAYLDSALTTTTTPSSSFTGSFSGAPAQPQTPSRRATRTAAATTYTPSSRRTPTATTTPSRATPARKTPATTPRGAAAAAAAGDTRTPTASSTKRKRGDTATTNHGGDGIVPAYVAPLIRALCRALDAPRAAVPHVYAGVQSVLKQQAANTTTPSRSSARKTRRAEHAPAEVVVVVGEKDVPPLVAVLLMYTMIRLSGRPTSAAEMRERRGKVVEVLREEGGFGETGEEEEGEEELVGRVEGLLVEVKERGWLDMEWFGNVVQQGEDEGEDVDVEMEDGGDTEADEDGDEDEGRGGVPQTPYTPLKKRKTKAVDVQAGVSQGGLGTMMQDKVDYLSEARRAGFLRWKAKIMKRVEQIEREDGQQAMDVSV